MSRKDAGPYPRWIDRRTIATGKGRCIVFGEHLSLRREKLEPPEMHYSLIALDQLATDDDLVRLASALHQASDAYFLYAPINMNPRGSNNLEAQIVTVSRLPEGVAQETETRWVMQWHNDRPVPHTIKYVPAFPLPDQSVQTPTLSPNSGNALTFFAQFRVEEGYYEGVFQELAESGNFKYLHLVDTEAHIMGIGMAPVDELPAVHRQISDIRGIQKLDVRPCAPLSCLTYQLELFPTS